IIYHFLDYKGTKNGRITQTFVKLFRCISKKYMDYKERLHNFAASNQNGNGQYQGATRQG
ncbi:MAG: hypothetical protein LBE91_21580, partial [Tannerella sp.]|nr:hypothetical protein [Tannerella sp.]